MYDEPPPGSKEYLQQKDIPSLINDLISEMVRARPDNTQQFIEDFLSRRKRRVGKGAHTRVQAAPTVQKSLVKSSGPMKAYDPMEDYNVPAFALRDPKIRPTTRDMENGGYIKWPITRSEMKSAKVRTNYASTVNGQLNYALSACKAECEKLAAECKKQNKQFWDDQFWFGKRSSMYPKGAPSDCTVTEPTGADRMQKLFPGAPLFKDGTDAADIVQGAIGDCFFIGAVSALGCCTAQKIQPLQRLFAYTNFEYGIYGVVMFKNGGWEWCILDDWIATQAYNGKNIPLYACPGNGQELWPMIIEKAYAKIHFAWDTIDGGWTREALGDLTGGLEYTLNLYKDTRIGGPDFRAFKEVVDDELTVIGCGVGSHVRNEGGAGRAGESGAVYGLFKGHAYSVLKFAVASDGTGFVRVRNPWGNEAEWTGPYGDKSSDWKRNPQHQKDLNPEFKDDGAFWMKWDDFRKYFTDIDVVRYFEDHWVCITLFGVAPRFDLVPENTYIVKVDKKATKVIVSIGQDDPKVKPDHYDRKSGRLSTCQISVFRLTALPDSYDQLQQNLGERVTTARLAQRTVDEEILMEPGYYSCVPKIDATGIGFYVRIFGPPDSELHVWRYSDGPGSALNIMHGITSATNIPVVIAPTVTPQVPTPTPVAPTPTPAPAPASTSTSSPTLLKTLGVDEAGLSKMLRKVFSDADTLNRGQLDKTAAKKSLVAIFDNPKFTSAFDSSWSVAEAAAGTPQSKYLGARLDFNKFEAMARKALSSYFS